jgi:hypothetical protein
MSRCYGQGRAELAPCIYKKLDTFVLIVRQSHFASVVAFLVGVFIFVVVFVLLLFTLPAPFHRAPDTPHEITTDTYSPENVIFCRW